MKTRLFPIALLVFACSSCSDDESPPLAPDDSTPTVYVNAATGDNANDGSAGAPWATITYALGEAGNDITIRVAPGTYSAASGETFPLQLREGQKLIGDVANKGMGATATRIQGEAPFVLAPMEGAAIVGNMDSRVAGFAIAHETNPNFYAGIAIPVETMEVDNNTFLTGMYTGLVAGNNASPDIHDNLFQVDTYGLVLDDTGAPHVHDNVIEQSGFGIRFFGMTGGVIENNHIRAVSLGVQAGSGVAEIRNNEFDSLAGYNNGAIRCYAGSPVVRGNTFASGPAVIVVNSGTPDLGTAGSLGLNDFFAVAGVALRHDGTGAVTAIGNTWANTPPLVGTDIVITSTGSVVTE